MEKIKKTFLLMAILIPAIAFTACGDDDDEPKLDITESYVTGGTWYVTDLYTNGKWVDISSEGLRATFDTDKEYRVGTGSYLNIHYYKGTWSLSGNTVNGVTVDGIHETFKFVETDGNTAVIDYKNDDTPADNFRWKATKR